MLSHTLSDFLVYRIELATNYGKKLNLLPLSAYLVNVGCELLPDFSWILVTKVTKKSYCNYLTLGYQPVMPDIPVSIVHITSNWELLSFCNFILFLYSVKLMQLHDRVSCTRVWFRCLSKVRSCFNFKCGSIFIKLFKKVLLAKAKPLMCKNLFIDISNSRWLQKLTRLLLKKNCWSYQTLNHSTTWEISDNFGQVVFCRKFNIYG